MKRMEPWRREIVSKGRLSGTVPQTDTGGRDEYSKAYEGTRVKELGKMHT
jgi:hypothetical protein